MLQHALQHPGASVQPQQQQQQQQQLGKPRYLPRRGGGLERTPVRADGGSCPYTSANTAVGGANTFTYDAPVAGATANAARGPAAQPCAFTVAANARNGATCDRRRARAPVSWCVSFKGPTQGVDDGSADSDSEQCAGDGSSNSNSGAIAAATETLRQLAKDLQVQGTAWMSPAHPSSVASRNGEDAISCASSVPFTGYDGAFAPQSPAAPAAQSGAPFASAGQAQWAEAPRPRTPVNLASPGPVTAAPVSAFAPLSTPAAAPVSLSATVSAATPADNEAAAGANGGVSAAEMRGFDVLAFLDEADEFLK